LAGHSISAANGREKKKGFMLNTNYLVSKRKKLLIVNAIFVGDKIHNT
jgi:hypothetical protein